MDGYGVLVSLVSVNIHIKRVRDSGKVRGYPPLDPWIPRWYQCWEPTWRWFFGGFFWVENSWFSHDENPRFLANIGFFGWLRLRIFSWKKNIMKTRWISGEDLGRILPCLGSRIPLFGSSFFQKRTPKWLRLQDRFIILFPPLGPFLQVSPVRFCCSFGERGSSFKRRARAQKMG